MVFWDSGCVVIHPELLCFSLGCRISYFQCHNRGGGVVLSYSSLNLNPDLKTLFLNGFLTVEKSMDLFLKSITVYKSLNPFIVKIKTNLLKLSLKYGLVFKPFPNNFLCVYFDSKYIFGASLVRICIVIWTIKLKIGNFGIFQMFLYNNM